MGVFAELGAKLKYEPTLDAVSGADLFHRNNSTFSCGKTSITLPRYVRQHSDTKRCRSGMKRCTSVWATEPGLTSFEPVGSSFARSH